MFWVVLQREQEIKVEWLNNSNFSFQKKETRAMFKKPSAWPRKTHSYTPCREKDDVT